MFVTHCYICNQPRGFARRLGFGTFFMALITLGLWLFTIPLYPLRCTTCGCTRGKAGQRRGNLACAVCLAVLRLGNYLWCAYYFRHSCCDLGVADRSAGKSTGKSIGGRNSHPNDSSDRAA